MFPVIITFVSCTLFFLIFILVTSATKKDFDTFIIKDIENQDIFSIIKSLKQSGDNFYILTNKKDEELFSYLKKHFYMEEAFTLVHRDN